MKRLLLLLVMFCFTLVNFGQSVFSKLYGGGILCVANLDSVKSFLKADDRTSDNLFYTNYTSVPEHTGKDKFFKYGIACLKDSGGWFKVMASPYFVADKNKESVRKDTMAIRYVKMERNLEYVEWKDFLPAKYIYGFKGNLYKDTLSKKGLNCESTYCLSCIRINGEWMEVKTFEKSDCTYGLAKQCIGNFWVRWHNEKEFLVKLKPY